ncbi:MAG: D-alanine--D-alanine ligase [Alphaproteobacteria bacterium]|nr:D-alanine--D-alanine ligase [Alphaproteobacteria bacterium]
MIDKKKVAVFFGARSPEHDVSVISGLQVLQAIDQSLYDAFPVYISPNGTWYVGDILRKRENYLLNEERMKHVTEVTLDMNAKRGGVLISKKTSLFGSVKKFPFDIAVPIFHGLNGEDGTIQGLFELVNIPFAGMRTKASSILMDKVATKYFMKALDIPVLDFAVLRRPVQGYVIPEDDLETLLEPVGFPCIIKPSHLGSSIGVGKASNIEEVRALLPSVFEYDDVAIAEPFVQNLVEYNVAVSRMFGEFRTSAIEKPKTNKELLDFKEKYMSGTDSKTGDKLGNKTFTTQSEGMLSLTREINPEIPEEMENNIRKWAVRMFEAIDGLGAPRIDFIGNSKTGELWINEVNPCPGSMGYFLWEAEKSDPVFFTDLISSLISEAVAENSRRALPYDPVPEGARLLKRS